MLTALGMFLNKLTQYSPLDGEEQKALLSLEGSFATLKAHSPLYPPAARPHLVSLVVEGIVGREEITAHAHRQTTAIYLNGDIPDLNCLYLPTADEGFVALAPTIVLRMPQAAFRSMMLQHPGISEAITRYLLLHAAITAKWLGRFGGRDAPSRMAHFFCEMALRSRSEIDNSFSYPMPLTQTQLAEVCGISTVHANRSMNALRKSNVLDLSHGSCEVRDWGGLVEIAGFNQSYLRMGQQFRLAQESLPETLQS
jgi:CRP-like cAMP-binding protein